VINICIIAAVARNGVIGRDGKLPWSLPEDLKRFKELTMGYPVIMGRLTWESLGKWRPLPGRQNIVVTRNASYEAPGAQIASSLDEAIKLCKAVEAPIAWVIGGQQLFKEALDVASLMKITVIHQDFEGDAWFPEFKPWIWEETMRESYGGPLQFDFVTYELR